MIFKTLSIPAMFAALALSSFALQGCEQEGPLEEAGEKADEAVQDTKRGVEDATD